ncbi:MAG: hypothetical protein AAFP19_25975, partial [Bacteroidota bacterium]
MTASTPGNYLVLCLLFLTSLLACTNGTPPESVTEENPSAPGFLADKSDPQAIQLADEVMKAMGGRQNWDQTRYLSWNFFGRRQLYWDRWTGNVRVESPGDSLTVLLNIHKKTGKVQKGGNAILQADSLANLVNVGYEIWVNDSYWLVMPFKLKDSGVSLRYVGKDTTQTGAASEVVELQFNEVGVTPENKYRVFIDPESKLVQQWSFYPRATDSTAQFVTPWDQYDHHG